MHQTAASLRPILCTGKGGRFLLMPLPTMTTAGIADAVDAGKELGVEIIPGIEVSGTEAKATNPYFRTFINWTIRSLKHFSKT